MFAKNILVTVPLETFNGKYLENGEEEKKKENSVGWQFTTLQILANNLSLNVNIFSIALKLLGYL